MYTSFQISNQESASALGTTASVFRVYDKVSMKPDYTLLTTDPPPHQLKAAPAKSNRKVAVVAKNDLVSQKVKPAAKKDKIEVVGMSKDKVQAPRYKSASQAAMQVKKDERKIELKITDNAMGAFKGKESKNDDFNPEISVSFTDSLASAKKTPVKRGPVQVSKTAAGAGDEAQTARDMATSVVSEQTKNATGVVSDTSDLDVWKQSKQSSAATTAAGRTPAKTVAIGKSADDKMVSLVGLNASDGTTTAQSAKPTAGSSDAAPGDDEQIQMVIQHPDGSYQVIEGEEAAKLMQQAADGGATFTEDKQGAVFKPYCRILVLLVMCSNFAVYIATRTGDYLA